MHKVLQNYFLAIPALVSGLFVLSTVANAAEVQTQSEIQDIAITPKPDVFKTAPSNLIAQVPVANSDVGQVTSVSQLSDVQPTDWAFQALQSLVERYGVIAGYPDGTFKGNRALTRYEFAAGLNAALDRLNELIASSTADLVKKEDLEILQKLQEQFAGELATLRGRVDAVEARTAKLEATQFSTTTKLQGLAQFFIGDTFGDRVGTNRDGTNTFFGYRATLALQSSFTGKDQLTTSLTASNTPILGGAVAVGGTPLTGTNQTRFNTERNTFYTDNSVYLDRLFYRFPLGSKTNVWIGARQLQPVTFAPTLNPLVGNAQSGTLSRFGLFNPVIYRPGFDGAGLAFAYKFNNQLQLNAGYIVDDALAANPGGNATNRGGLFGNSYEALGQLTFTPSPSLDISFAYARKYFPAPIALGPTGATTFAFGSGYNITGGTGTANAGRPFGLNPTSSDNFGLQFNWKASRALHIGGWFGYTEAHQEGTSNNATIINTALTLALPDLGKKGNLAGFVFGIPPKVTSNDVVAGRDSATSLHLEGFYTYRVNDNISVTPTLYVITNPQGNSANDAIWVGAVRTTFNF
ncbi:iron uptake porin [Calothrix sp. PCC 7507]|uniref:iron uptake porin n=1 Tax=Calothrix sp. PCC 7507 TaxID=99598 RepID=UPI00029F38FC|nr:iron uptake porin [Calothrix sp. PCC 7507]AFY31731.1 cyanobacterial porin [Calothrix sp. PCC 7507]